MTNEQSSGATETGLLDMADIHTKTLYLHGLMSVLTDFDPHDARTRNGAAAIVFVAEGLANEITRDMETLMEAGQ